jgi:hypothetical protein
MAQNAGGRSLEGLELEQGAATATPYLANRLGVTARNEILIAVRAILPAPAAATSNSPTCLPRCADGAAATPIRTHVTSSMCASAPAYHGSTLDAFERVGRAVSPAQRAAP